MKQDMLKRKLRAGIVGGGQGSFIGAVHHMAVELDGQVEVVAGAMSADPQRAEASAQAWYLKPSILARTTARCCGPRIGCSLVSSRWHVG